MSERLSEYGSMSLSRVKQLTYDLDRWFPDLHSIAIEAISYVVDVERALSEENNRPLSLRQLFRSATKYERFTKRHDELFQRSAASQGGASPAA